MLHKTLVYRDAQIAYYFAENKEKETILLLHPAFADHEIFEAQTESFMEDYQVIAVDMPGHGDSQIKGRNVTLKDMPAILHQIMSDHEISALHIVGVSMGSLVAQAFADRYPERVKSVTMVGGYSIHKANEQILKAQKKEGLKWLGYMLFSMKKFRDHVISVSCYTDRCRTVFRRGIGKFHRKSFSVMSGMNSFFRKQDTPVRYPLLIIVGQQDQQMIREAANTIHKLEKGSQLAVLPAAGHCANLDAPEEFNRLVKDFLLDQ
ncbi:pimeloyl-ACP methyl ester carboxylesterase [Tumebacillus sp. BK434]|nr:pimeloyl-ACP methyl ester carboxylesterase [Tumebacillus sp. BK434]